MLPWVREGHYAALRGSMCFEDVKNLTPNPEPLHLHAVGCVITAARVYTASVSAWQVPNPFWVPYGFI